MIKSEQLDMLAPALSRAQNQIRSIAHDSINPNFESGFTSLQAVIKATLPVLESNQLAVSQAFDGGDDETINIETYLIHGSGQFIGSRLRIPARPIKRKQDKEAGPINAQSVGSAITYGRRYALVSLLGIATDKDDDGNTASNYQYRSDSIPDRAQKPTPAQDLPTYPQTEDNEFGGEEPAKLDQVGKLRTYSGVPVCKPIIKDALKRLGYGSYEQMTQEEADKLLNLCQDAMNGPAEPEPETKSKKTCPKELKFLEKWMTGHEARINKFLEDKKMISCNQTWRDLPPERIGMIANDPDQFAAAVDIPEPTNTPY